MSKNILIGIYVELTNKCNRNCPYCYNDSGNKTQFIDTNDFYKIIDECKENNISQITLSGGEPFLHPNIMDFIKYANSVKIFVKIITNLSLISVNDVVELLKKGNSIQITLDSPNEKNNDFTRGYGSYNKTLEILNKIKDSNLTDKIFLRMNLHKKNIDDIDQFIDFSIHYNLKNVAITLLAKTGRGISFPYTYDYNESMIEIMHIVKKLKAKKNQFSDILNISYSNLEDQRGCIIFQNDGLKIIPKIDPYGNVYFCSYFFGDENILGNIHQSSLLEIINSTKLEKFIKKIRNRPQNNDCINCSFNKICLCGCPAVSYMHTNNTQEKNDQCQLIKFFIKDSLKDLMRGKYE